jgi:hypothetical protein
LASFVAPASAAIATEREDCGMTIGWVKDDMAVLFPDFGEEWEIAAY